MKKLFIILTAGIILGTSSVVPASAAQTSFTTANTASVYSAYSSNYFTGSTGKMNSLYGRQSNVFNISSGSIYNLSEVTGITVNVTVSSGSSPFYLVIEDPDGDISEKYVSRSGAISISDFNGVNPKGTWKVYIASTGTVSTATARMTVNYRSV